MLTIWATTAAAASTASQPHPLAHRLSPSLCPNAVHGALKYQVRAPWTRSRESPI